MELIFLSTLPARGATRSCDRHPRAGQHFYPHSPRGERPDRGAAAAAPLHFYPHSPRGERPEYLAHTWVKSPKFLSTLPARGATASRCNLRGRITISIHTPREGSDLVLPLEQLPDANFYPHSPRGERPINKQVYSILYSFLSTLPARGATGVTVVDYRGAVKFLSTLPARGATGERRSGLQRRQFLSTLPARGATRHRRGRRAYLRISIHTPREGSDHSRCLHYRRRSYFYPHSPRGERRARGPRCCVPAAYFYPHSPRGERPTSPAALRALTNFYPHSPRGERQRTELQGIPAVHISIHTPREGSDQNLRDLRGTDWYFYPHSPRGERPAFSGRDVVMRIFLSTLPARGATNGEVLESVAEAISIHTPREGSDRQEYAGRHTVSYFYPHSPRGERHFYIRKVGILLAISIHTPREGSDA